MLFMIFIRSGKSLFESFESRVNAALNTAREQAGAIAAKYLDDKNNIVAMGNSGQSSC